MQLSEQDTILLMVGSSFKRKGQAGKVLPSPFQQSEFNEALQTMLIAPEKEQWAQNGILYGQTEDLYSLPEAAADLIEQLFV